MVGETKPAGARAVRWGVTGESVRGASHRRAGRPNQDAILILRESGTAGPVVLAASDGHGSEKCFRSDRGSRFAVEVGAFLARDFLRQTREGDPARAELRAKERLPAEFVRRWRAAVEADLQVQPFTSEEMDALASKHSPQAREAVEANPALAYGATALVVGVSESVILYLQLGDGEILTVSDAGEVTRPLAPDARLFANETTSLCLPRAAEDFRVAVRGLSPSAPALFLVTTDGYANSFSDEAGFLKVGSDVLEMLRSDGFEAVSKSLEQWLSEATEVGSGDDTTLGLICRMDALSNAHTQADAPASVETPTADQGSTGAAKPESEQPIASAESQG